jgi:hypothetical protein
MIERGPLCAERIRKISGGFAFIEHRFLRDGFFQSLNHHELLLYLFLVLVSDRLGLSYYSYDKICTLLRFTLDEYLLARDGLIGKDLVAFDGSLYQVLSLPDRVDREEPKALKTQQEFSQRDPATVRRIILDSLGGGHG